MDPEDPDPESRSKHMAGTHAPVRNPKHGRRTPPSANMMVSEVFAELFPIYLECSNEVQAAIKDMVLIVNDPEATEDERHMAVATIAEALFPASCDSGFGVDLENLNKAAVGDEAQVLDRMAAEQATFSERLQAVMDRRGVTQAELAKAIGVGQPAISMLLSRECRPQRRTVEKIAKALKVPAEEIWPGFRDEG